jgi:hypothetical protein
MKSALASSSRMPSPALARTLAGGPFLADGYRQAGMEIYLLSAMEPVMGAFARLWSPAVWTHAAGDPDGFGTGEESVSRPPHASPAFVRCAKDPHGARGVGSRG